MTGHNATEVRSIEESTKQLISSLDLHDRGRILLVDDEPETLSVLCEIFKKWGYDVTGLQSSKESLEMIQNQNFHILMSDLTMPDIDGIALIQNAKMIDPKIICIIITGHGTIQTSVEAMKSGAFDFVLKPFDLKMLKMAVDRAMQMSRLEQSRALYHAIVEDYQDEFICRFLPDRRLTFANNAYYTFLNHSKKELIGQDFMQFILETDKERVLQQLSSLNTDMPVVICEYRVMGQTGAINWQQWIYRGIFKKRKSLIEIQGIGHDITLRKQMEDDLKQSEALYRTLFDNTGTALVVIEEDMTICMMNDEATRLTGYAKQEVEGRIKWSQFIHSAELVRLQEYHKQRRADADSVPNTYETLIRDKADTVKDVSVTVSMIPGTKRSVASLVDITQRKRMEKELRKKVNELEEFYNIAIGREVKMKKLKEELDSLKSALEKNKKGE